MYFGYRLNIVLKETGQRVVDVVEHLKNVKAYAFHQYLYRPCITPNPNIINQISKVMDIPIFFFKTERTRESFLEDPDAFYTIPVMGVVTDGRIITDVSPDIKHALLHKKVALLLKEKLTSFYVTDHSLATFGIGPGDIIFVATRSSYVNRDIICYYDEKGLNNIRLLHWNKLDNKLNKRDMILTNDTIHSPISVLFEKPNTLRVNDSDQSFVVSGKIVYSYHHGGDAAWECAGYSAGNKKTLNLVNVSKESYNQAYEILHSLGIDMDIAIEIFVKRIVQEKGLPFSMTIKEDNDK